MADQKLPQLTELATTPDSGDLVYVVDVSDTTDDVTGTSKKIQASNLLGGKADVGHTHTKSDITDFGVDATEVDSGVSTDGQVLTSDGAGNAAWEAIPAQTDADAIHDNVAGEINAVTEKVTPVNGDWVLIEDSADSNNKKKAQLGNLPGGGGGSSTLSGLTDTTITSPATDEVLTYNGSAWVNQAASGGASSTAAGTKVLLEEITLASAGEFDFSSIPAGYDRLIIEGYIRSGAAGTNDNSRIFINGDTTDANYHSVLLYTDQGTSGGAEYNTAYTGNIAAAGSPTDSYSNTRWVIEGYTDTAKLKTVQADVYSYLGTDHGNVAKLNVTSNTSTVVNQIQVRTDNHPTDGLTGTLRLYGEKSLTVENSETITVKEEVPVTLTGGDYSIDLTNYQDGDRLVIEGQIASSIAATQDDLRVEINSDTTVANYWFVRLLGNGSALSGTASENEAGIITGSTGFRDSAVKIVVEDYATASKTKAVEIETSYALTSTTGGVAKYTVHHKTDTAAITNFVLTAAGGNLSGTVKAYIEKSGVLPVVPTTSTATGTKVLLDEIELTSAGEFDFDNIPSGYDRLILQGTIRGTVSAASDSALLFLNADTTTTNYHRQSAAGVNGVANSSEANTADGFYTAAASSPANWYSTVYMELEDYTGSNNKTMRTMSNTPNDTANLFTGITTVQSSVTDAVTRLRVRADNHPTDGLIGTLRLYGEKSLSVVDSETITVKQEVPVTLTGGEYIIDLANYQDGDRLILEGELQSDDTTAQTDSVYIYFNDDETATNYWSQIVAAGADAFDDRGATPKIGYAATEHASNDANAKTPIRIVVERYASASGYQLASASVSSIADANSSFSYAGWAAVTRVGQAAAITKVKLSPVTGSFNDTGFKAYIEKSGVLPVSQGPHVLQTITLSTAGEFDFDSIPSGYRRLVVKGTVRSSAAATFDNMRVYVNTDTTDANYHTQVSGATNNSAINTEYASPNVLYSTGGNSPAGANASLKLELEDYTGSGKKLIEARAAMNHASGEAHIADHAIGTSVTAAVTRLRIRTDNDPTDGLTGTLTLYGEY